MLSKLQTALRSRLPRAPVVRSILLLAGSTATAQLIGICAMPLVTRLYTPEQIGIVSLFLSFFGFWATTLSWRYEYALLIARDDAESHVICRLAIGIVIFMSLLAVPLLWVLQSGNFMEFGLLPAWAPIIAFPILVGHGIFMVYRSWALRAGLIRHITQATIYRSGAGALSKVGLGVLGWGVVGLFIAELAAACASMFKLLVATTSHYAASKPGHIDGKTFISTGRRYAKFPLLETPSAWLDALAAALPLPLVATLYGPEAAGWFGLARMVVSVPNSQIGSAVADVFQMELAKAVLDHDAPRARRLFYAIMKKAALFGLVPLLGVVAFLPWLMSIVFGGEWAPAGLAAAALAPWFYAALVISPLSRALSVLQAQELKFFYDVSAVGLLLSAFFAAQALKLSFIEFCLAISLAKSVGYLVYCVVLIRLIESRAKNKPETGA